jgi:hypothetical protein
LLVLFVLQRYRARIDWLRLARELPLVIVLYFVYFLVRGATQGDEAQALQNAASVVDLERALGIFWEPAWQRAIIDRQWMVNVVNWLYIWGHWPVIVAAALWLFIARQREYYLYRNAFLISGGIGVIIFALFPVAPPRLAGVDVVDTVTLHSQAYRVLQPPVLVNQYAAVPSLHFGWNLLIGIAIVSYARSPFVRALGVALPPLMLAAIVLTANHFLLDAVAGGALSLAALWAASRLTTHDAGGGEERDQRMHGAEA